MMKKRMKTFVLLISLLVFASSLQGTAFASDVCKAQKTEAETVSESLPAGEAAGSDESADSGRSDADTEDDSQAEKGSGRENTADASEADDGLDN